MGHRDGGPIDVLGLSVAEARRRLHAAGVTEVVEVMTAPPRGAGEGQARVVRQRAGDEGGELVVAVFPRLES
jgi:hypothetical protein